MLTRPFLLGSDGSLCTTDLGSLLDLELKDVSPVVCERIQRLESFSAPGLGKKRVSMMKLHVL